MRDDLGVDVPLAGTPTRVVSLVPSLTEALAPTGVLVGATDWCTHPPGLDVERFRGTKNPDVRRIVAAAPDLVVANQEENRELDVRRLREAGVAVWVTRIETVPEALDAMDRLFAEALGLDRPDWLAEARRLWDVPPPAPTARVAIAVWRDPWMVVGGRTFTGDLARRLGWVNAFGAGPDRYPAVTLADLDRPDLDLVLLPDEPYAFTAEDGPEAFTQVATRLVSGRLLTWYGPSLLEARSLAQGEYGSMPPVLQREPDPAFLAFLRARLHDEVERAEPDRRGVDLIHELLWAMEHGHAPDPMSLGLLTVAYAKHPDFREEWNRWRR